MLTTKPQLNGRSSDAKAIFALIRYPISGNVEKHQGTL
jgi:hypothetical protein